MYKIIGGDGKEYGPITLDQLKQWIAEGRVNAQTKVLVEGAADWKTVSEIPELASAIPVIQPLPTAPVAQPGLVPSGEQVRGPAIFLLVLAILDILATLAGIAFIAFGQSLPFFANVPPESMALQQKFSMFFSLPSQIIGGVLAIVRLFGSLKMMKLQSHGWAMTTAILTLIPCSACCCLLNVGAGIWALIVLAKPEVKAAFNQNS